MAYLLCTEFFLSCVFLNLQCNWNVKCFFGRWCDTLITQHKLDSSIFSSNHLCVICFFLLYSYICTASQPFTVRECFDKSQQQIHWWIYGAIYFLLRLLIKLCMWFIVHTYQHTVCVSARDFFFRRSFVRVGSIFVNWRKCFSFFRESVN